MIFYEKHACKSEVHCKRCREKSTLGAQWRMSIIESYEDSDEDYPNVDFPCHKDKAWIEVENGYATPVIHRTPNNNLREECIHKGDELGEVEKSCCGGNGKKKKVKAYHCNELDKPIVISECKRCLEYKKE